MPIARLTENPAFGPVERSPRVVPLIWRELFEIRRKVNEIIGSGAAGDMHTSVYDTDADNVVDNSEALGGVAAASYARRDDDNTFASAKTQTIEGRLDATTNNVSANVVIRWLDMEDGGDGIQFPTNYEDPPGTPRSTRIILSSANGRLNFTVSGDTPASYAYYFDQPIAVADLIMTSGTIETDTSTGLQIGTSSTQKLGFWGATPVAKTTVALGNADNEIGGLTISAAYSQSEVQALRDKCEELADDVRAIHAALQTYGLE